MDGQERIEQVGKLDAVGLRNEAEQGAIPIEAPGPAFRDHFERGLAIPVEQFVAKMPGGILVRHLDGDGAEPLDVEDRGQSLGKDAADRTATGDVFKPGHALGHRRRILDGLGEKTSAHRCPA